MVAIFFSLWLPLSSAYLSYDGLGEVDFLAPFLIFENPDQDDLLVDQQSKDRIFLADLDPLGVLLQFYFFKPFIESSRPALSSAHLSTPLRC